MRQAVRKCRLLLETSAICGEGRRQIIVLMNSLLPSSIRVLIVFQSIIVNIPYYAVANVYWRKEPTRRIKQWFDQ